MRTVERREREDPVAGVRARVLVFLSNRKPTWSDTIQDDIQYIQAKTIININIRVSIANFQISS